MRRTILLALMGLSIAGLYCSVCRDDPQVSSRSDIADAKPDAKAKDADPQVLERRMARPTGEIGVARATRADESEASPNSPKDQFTTCDPPFVAGESEQNPEAVLDEIRRGLASARVRSPCPAPDLEARLRDDLLHLMGNHDSPAAAMMRREIVKRLSDFRSQASLEALELAALQDPSVHVRKSAIASISKYWDTFPVGEFLVRVAEGDSLPDVRAAAIGRLGTSVPRGDQVQPQAISALKWAVERDEPEPATSAIEALGFLLNAADYEDYIHSRIREEARPIVIEALRKALARVEKRDRR